MNNKIISIFGGSGFIGHYLVKHLVESGFIVKILTSDLCKTANLRISSNPGRVICVQYDIFDTDSIEKYISDSHFVINLVATFKDSDKSDFTYLHAKFPEKIAKIVKKLNIGFIHLSNLGINNISTVYSKSRMLGENAIQNAYDKSIILQSSLVYGQEDSFLNVLYNISKAWGFLPLINGGTSKVQPIYVDDLARVISRLVCIDYPGGVYKVAGNEIFKLIDIYSIFEEILRRRVRRISIPVYFMEFIIMILNIKIFRVINRLVFGKGQFPFSSEQLKLLNVESTVENFSDNLINKLKIEVNSLQDKIKEYLY